MTLPSGWAEFNSDAVFRGRMDAAGGTFSGVFSADAIEVIDTINVRDGAVSRDTILTIEANSAPASSQPISGGTLKTYVKSFSVPPPLFPGSYLEIQIPFRMWAEGRVNPNVGLPLSVKRNGVSIGSETLYVEGFSEYVDQGSDMEHYGHTVPFMMRILDMNPGATATNYEMTYTVFSNTAGWFAARQHCAVEPVRHLAPDSPTTYPYDYEIKVLISERLR